MVVELVELVELPEEIGRVTTPDELLASVLLELEATESPPPHEATPSATVETAARTAAMRYFKGIGVVFMAIGWQGRDSIFTSNVSLLF